MQAVFFKLLLCPISNQGSQLRRGKPCLLWHHPSGLGWTLGCCSETETGSQLGELVIFSRLTLLNLNGHHLSHVAEGEGPSGMFKFVKKSDEYICILQYLLYRKHVVAIDISPNQICVNSCCPMFSCVPSPFCLLVLYWLSVLSVFLCVLLGMVSTCSPVDRRYVSTHHPCCST